MRTVSARLIAHETRGQKSAEAAVQPAALIREKLRPHLATLMGNTGSRVLLARALALATAEVAWLRTVRVKADGSLEGWDELQAQIGPEDITEGGVVLLAQLLGLLVAFIGENLTLRLVRDVWPKLSIEGLEPGTGENQ